MDYKKTNAAGNTITRDICDMSEDVGNVYKSIMIMAKRSNQIGAEIKEELKTKIEEFASYTDNLEEMFENREQIEISRFYERLPKATLIAVQEYLEGNIYHRDGKKESK